MDFAGERHIKLCRVLLTAIGLWPYNDSAFIYIQRIFFVALLSFSISAQLGNIIASISNSESVLEILSFAVPCLIFSLKYATFCIKSKELKKLLDQIKYHWDVIKCKKELEILHEYANIGNLIISLFVLLLYVVVFLFLTMQMLPKLLDIVMPLNESRPFHLLGVATFFFDEKEYFFPIFTHMTVALLVESTTILATEAMCMACMQHSFGLFKVTSFRIEHAFDCELNLSVVEKNRIYYTNILNAVFLHNKAFEFFERFNSCMEVSYFLFLLLGVCSLSINMFRFGQAVFKKKMEELFAIGLFVIIHFIYMFINNFVAQIVTNKSEDIFYEVCQLPWHSVPVQLQKLLQFIMQRSMKSCKFAMSGMFTGSLECFASLISASLSYFMVFWSMDH